jgi:hypothetical protein
MKGRNILRIYPAFENGRELPWRLDEREGGYSPWIFGARFVKGMGVNNRFTCFTSIVDQDPQERGPIDVFSSTMISAIGQSGKHLPDEWSEWVKGGPNRGRKIPPVDHWAFVQGALYECGDRKFLSSDRQAYDPKRPVLMALSKSARISVEKMTNTEVVGYRDDPEDYSKRFVCGDFLSCAGGRLAIFTSNPGDTMIRPHYVLSFGDAVVPLNPEEVARDWTPWENLLKFLTTQEQMNLLCTHFPPGPVDYVFTGTQFYDLVPDSVRGAWQREQTRHFPQQTQQQHVAYQPQQHVAYQPQQHVAYQPQGATGIPTAASSPGMPTHGNVGQSYPQVSATLGTSVQPAPVINPDGTISNAPQGVVSAAPSGAVPGQEGPTLPGVGPAPTAPTLPGVGPAGPQPGPALPGVGPAPATPTLPGVGPAGPQPGPALPGTAVSQQPQPQPQQPMPQASPVASAPVSPVVQPGGSQPVGDAAMSQSTMEKTKARLLAAEQAAGEENG